MTEQERAAWVACRDRARKQIALGKRLHRRLRGYASRNDCVDAAHFLIADGGAARQGDDPRWLLSRDSPGLAHLVPLALQVERRAVKAWPPNEALRVTRRLLADAATRANGERILAIYHGA